MVLHIANVAFLFMHGGLGLWGMWRDILAHVRELVSRIYCLSQYLHTILLSITDEVKTPRDLDVS